MRLDDQEQLIRDLEGTLQHAAMETDRKLTTQQQEYEKKMQILLRQLTEGKDDATSDTRSEVVFILSDVTRFVEFSSAWYIKWSASFWIRWDSSLSQITVI